MKKYTKEAVLYGNCGYSLFYINGSDSCVNRCVGNNKERILSYLWQRDVLCKDFKILSSSFFGRHSVKNLLLRQNPSLFGEQLRLCVKECKEKKRIGTLFYVSPTGVAEEGSSYIIYEEALPVDGNCEENIFRFLDYVIEEEGKRVVYERLLSYRVADSVDNSSCEYDSWSDGEYMGMDLLADSFCEKRDQPISPLKFDDNYNIILPLYPHIKIEMEPLPKTLYILMLSHPEGFLLKNISEYTDEIREIYCKVSGRKNPTVIKRLLAAVTDPLNNPLHRNISLIRQGFLSKLSSDIARNYMPVYNRSKAQYVPISKELVELPSLV